MFTILGFAAYCLVVGLLVIGVMGVREEADERLKRIGEQRRRIRALERYRSVQALRAGSRKTFRIRQPVSTEVQDKGARQ